MPAFIRKHPELALLALAFAVAGFFRFYQIASIPPGLYPDEAMNGNNAVEALSTGTFKIFYPENNGREGFFINIQALSVWLFGPEAWALRIVSAFIGTLTVLGVWLLARELFSGWTRGRPEAGDPRASEPERDLSPAAVIALASAFLIATSYWHVNFSRIGFRAIMVPLFVCLGLAFLLRALRTGSIPMTVLGGLATGLGFHTYIAFRFMPLVLAIPIVAALRLWYRGLRKQPCVPCVAALFLFVAFVAALPIGLYFLNHPADFLGRSGQVSIFSANDPLREFVKSSVITLGMLNLRGDCNPRHNFACFPELSPVVGVFFLIGFCLLLLALFRRGDPNRFPASLLVGSFLVMMLPASLTREGLPHALRSIGMIPAVFIIAGYGAWWLWERFGEPIRRAEKNPANAPHQARIRRIQKELAILAVVAMVWIAGEGFRNYFFRFPVSTRTPGAFATDLWHGGRYLASLPDDIKKIVVVNSGGDPIRGIPASAQTVMFATGTFLEQERERKNFRYVANIRDIRPGDIARTVVYPMNPLDLETREAIRKRFPGLEGVNHNDFILFEQKSAQAPENDAFGLREE
ncbi:hypothetical protein A3A38_03025 [Candidatus Kaiserbacteria bacterium RIFCSPLOWO2_01_FULL_53_17]|uniref:Glycosyltransferase RgtA/B/C/D-like domain-containing protein n=1 Tax=Candidatus Kaiserbacteria bacterium RIFCSPLOWO2_01_FULL_53_17 TaxID=1798511 RepID=A0A1F6EIC4_9BACT|nr:MAG: hypothetical protein A3A38_03025 [Candidatus Kaiserbacteria bacterium RIFCSPLOWO2_01_FULL_53_17]